jgi:hypothetical protein
VGAKVGFEVGRIDGITDGRKVGFDVGENVGAAVGMNVGADEGLYVGTLVGVNEGVCVDGLNVGLPVPTFADEPAELEEEAFAEAASAGMTFILLAALSITRFTSAEASVGFRRSCGCTIL